MGVGLFLIFCVQIRANALKNEANTMGVGPFKNFPSNFAQMLPKMRQIPWGYSYLWPGRKLDPITKRIEGRHGERVI